MATLTRRDFVKNLSVLGLVPLAGRASTLTPVEPTKPAQALPYPDLDRTAAIDEWEGIFDQAIIELERVWTLLGQSRAKAPADVDAIQLYDAIENAREAIDDLSIQMQMVDFEELFTLITGQQSYLILVERELNKPDCDFDWWQRELNYLAAEKGSEEVAHLQAILNARRGGAS